MVFESDWNSAQEYLHQINYLLMQGVSHQVAEDYSNSLKNFHAAHQMLVAHMKVKTHDKNIASERDEAQARYERAKRLIDGGLTNVDKNLILKALDDYNLILRVVVRKRRMDVPRGQDPGSGLLASGGDGEQDGGW